jgi:hypothetical protein
MALTKSVQLYFLNYPIFLCLAASPPATGCSGPNLGLMISHRRRYLPSQVAIR